MTVVQIEETCDSLVQRLRDQLNEKIDQINLQADDGYGIEYPVQIVFGYRSETPYPTVQVLPQNTQTTVDTGMRVHYNHTVQIVSWVADMDEEALCRKLVRYQRAVRETALSLRQLHPTSAGYGIQHTRDDYGPPFQAEGFGQFIAWARSNFTIQQQQDLYT